MHLAKIIYCKSELQNGAQEYCETLRAREPSGVQTVIDDD